MILHLILKINNNNNSSNTTNTRLLTSSNKIRLISINIHHRSGIISTNVPLAINVIPPSTPMRN